LRRNGSWVGDPSAGTALSRRLANQCGFAVQMLIYRREHSRHGRLGEQKDQALCGYYPGSLSAKGEYGSAIRATTSTITNQGNRTIESSIAIFSKYPLLCFQVAARPR
jgi:hypothetical protein